MWFVLTIMLICVLVSKDNENKRLQGEIKQLKNKIKSLENPNLIDTILEPVHNEKIEVKKVKKEELNSEEKKNISILVAGSILIILSAIVFLTTAWNTIPDIIKTVALFLFAGIFLGASKIAKNKFHLEKASKTFFYIAMAYLPICFVSISIFGLLGQYLSITGDGRFLYLGICAVILAILYYAMSKKSTENYLIYGSALSQLLGVILFSLLFEENIFLCCINLLIYNLLLIFMTKNTIFRQITNFIPAIVGVIALAGLDEMSGYAIFTFLLLVPNFLILELEKPNPLKAFAFNFYLILFGVSLILKDSFGLSDRIQQILLLLYMIPVFGIEHLMLMDNSRTKNILVSSRILTVLSLSYIYIFSISESNLLIPSFVVALIFMAILILCLKISKNIAYKYIAYSFINVLLLDINNNLISNIKLIHFVPFITSLIVVGCEKLYSNEKNRVSPIYLTILESIALIAICCKREEVGAIIALMYVIGIIYYNKANKFDIAYNVLPLVLLIPNIYLAKLSDELEIGIMILSSIGLCYLSIQGKSLNIYTIFSVIYLLFGISKFDNMYLSEMLFIAWAVVHLYYFKGQNEKDIFKTCAIIGITSIYYSICNDLELMDYTLFKLLGGTIAGFVIIKNVIVHYTKDVDFFEYAFWIFIYSVAITSYTSSADGILFSLLILGIIFISYYQKYGATFLSAILAIIVNGFLLTRAFWLNIPWWIYLLVVGATLIGFAIKNEANENKISVKKVLKNIKESCEK